MNTLSRYVKVFNLIICGASLLIFDWKILLFDRNFKPNKKVVEMVKGIIRRILITIINQSLKTKDTVKFTYEGMDYDAEFNIFI